MLLLFCGLGPATAQEEAASSGTTTLGNGSAYMFGDWGGRRTALAEKGVALELIQVDDYLLDGSGDGANWSRIRGTVDVDFTKANIVPRLKFHITAMWQAGGNLGTRIEAVANPSSLASIGLIRLDSWWFELEVAPRKFFLRAGQFAGLDSYGVQRYGDSFINLPLGYAMSNLINATYETFAPAATPAFELRYAPTARFYAKSAIFSGNRNPFHDDENGLHFRFKDAPVIAGEVGYLMRPKAGSFNVEPVGSYALGTTVNTGPFDHIATSRRKRSNYLVYFTANRQLYRSRQRGRSIDGTFTVNWTPQSYSRTFSQLTAGLRFHGAFLHRERDTLSFGFVHSRISDSLNRSPSQRGQSPLSSEKLLEVNYALRVRPWFTIQPVVQYFLDLGASPQRGNHTIFGFRSLFVL